MPSDPCLFELQRQVAECDAALSAALRARNARICALKDDDGWTQGQLARATGLKKQHISTIVKAAPQYDDQAARSIAAVRSLSRAAPPVVNAEVIGELPAPAWFGASEARKWDAAVARYRFVQARIGEAADSDLDLAARVAAMADASRTARMLAVDAEGLATTLRRSHGL